MVRRLNGLELFDLARARTLVKSARDALNRSTRCEHLLLGRAHCALDECNIFSVIYIVVPTNLYTSTNICVYDESRYHIVATRICDANEMCVKTSRSIVTLAERARALGAVVAISEISINLNGSPRAVQFIRSKCHGVRRGTLYIVSKEAPTHSKAGRLRGFLFFGTARAQLCRAALRR